ncbi:MAG: hypothetical protein DBX52_06325 [Clostridiales bacterium]|nr:MAG: hypothetical protein DBX52_06325 [Clostridiales bacterium]
MKKNTFTAGIAAVLAFILLAGGGTFAYLKGTTDKIENHFNPNQVLVTLHETENDYEIVPGTWQTKDPQVTVNATLPAYVYVMVENQTNGLVDYEIDARWTPLGDTYPGVYWCEVAGGEAPETIPVLKGNRVSYDAALENSNMLDETGRLKEGITLTFQARAIQKEPFNDPVDAYEEKVQVQSTLEAAFRYQGSETEGNEKFVAEAFSTADSTLYQAAAIKSYYGSNTWWKDVKYVFSLKGTSNQEMKLTFDFSEKCGENGTYKGLSFENGFGGFGDTFLLAGEYDDPYQNKKFTLVGDYYPVVFNVTQTKGTALDFSFHGSLTELIRKLSESAYTLKAGTVYDEEFEITMSWPFETPCTDACYVTVDGEKQALMDIADTLLGDAAVNPQSHTGLELWADFEVKIAADY